MNPPRIRAYVRALVDEIEECAGSGFRPRTIFIGGGTPSALDDESWDLLLASLSGAFGEGLLEWTIEANPESIDARKLESALGHGVDRISTGAQTFDEKGLSLLGRRHDAKRVLEVHQLMKDLGVPRTSLDLIVGWPGQEEKAIETDLAAVEQIDPDHVSLYHLSYEQGTWLHRMLDRGAVDPLLDEDCISCAPQILSGLDRLGIFRYEVSNLYRRGGASLHNLNYWKRGEYRGVGSGAASFLEGVRWKNKPDVQHYIDSGGRPEAVEREEVSRFTVVVESIMLGLRLSEGVNLQAIRRQTGLSVGDICSASLRQFEDRGLLYGEGDTIRVTETGFEVLDSLIIELIEELEKSPDGCQALDTAGSDHRDSNPPTTRLGRG